MPDSMNQLGWTDNILPAPRETGQGWRIRRLATINVSTRKYGLIAVMLGRV
jgi:hypothetical protein